MSTETAETLPATRPAQPGGKSVLAADLRIVGDIRANGSVEILGVVDGTIESQGVIIGQDGQLKGRITAETVDIRGTTNGKISCKSLTLRSTSNVKTDVNYTTLIIESGATIEGKFTRAKS
jgi:cytoskeletal protein CcmA (bactofilin family)